LCGANKNVAEAEKYFKELCKEMLPQIRTSDIIWSVHVANGQWEQYSHRMNTEIEYAYQKQLSQVDIVNDASETVHIKFMKDQLCEEIHDRIRAIRRQIMHQILPDFLLEQFRNNSRILVLGVVYGCGVYFSENAKYSHDYAKVNSNNERTMFLARILVGRTAVGTKGQKVPPPGCDTTTNEKQTIFVVYHDSQAYPDYLIKYK
ncbi:unnamed protein product, partial [Didymodactylos carnosus]